MIISESELYQIIGELYVARALTDRVLKEMTAKADQAWIQIDEMANVNTKLREEIITHLNEIIRLQQKYEVQRQPGETWQTGPAQP